MQVAITAISSGKIDLRVSEINISIFSFYHFDRWHDIIVDKRLPMYGCAKAAYSKAFTRVMTSKGKMEDDVDFWVPLLEKGKLPHFFTTIFFTEFLLHSILHRLHHLTLLI